MISVPFAPGSREYGEMAGNKEYVPFGESLVSWRGVTYVKIRNLGSGGSSNVYLTLATSGPNKGIAFAAKVFSPRGTAEEESWRLNFMREVHVLRDCDHPAIMKVFDEGIYRDEFPFVVMEFLPNTLSRIPSGPPPSDAQKFSFVMQLLSALKYLSHRDPAVVHRDIKPSNIFLKGDSCVLGDFGLVLQLDETKQSGLEKRPTPAVSEMAKNYRTPELVAYHNGGPAPSTKSDVFQLGLVACELFTGKNPLLAASPEKPIELNPVAGVSGPLGTRVNSLIDQMLVFEPEKRPAASELLESWQELYRALCKREHAEPPRG